MAIYVVHAEHARGAQVLGINNVVRRNESVLLMLEIGCAPHGAKLLFPFRCPFQQLEVHQRIGNVPVVLAEELAVFLEPHDEMFRLHVQDAKSFAREFVRAACGQFQHGFPAAFHVRKHLHERFNARDAFDPFIDQDVLAIDVEFDIAEFLFFPLDLGHRTPCLPKFQFLRGHVDGERTVGAGRAALKLVAHFHNERKLLVGAVEFRLDEFAEREGVERHGFADAAPFHDEIFTEPADLSGLNTIHRAGALELFAVLLEPFFFIPVLGFEMFVERHAIAREVQVAAVAGFDMGVMHPQQGDIRGFLGQRCGRLYHGKTLLQPSILGI